MPSAESGAGVFRRRIHISATAETQVVAQLEDDFHHFRVTMSHDGNQVVECEGEAVRYPWSECPGAIDPLRELEGMALVPRSSAVAVHVDVRQNCTHLFDLAALAITHAAAGRQQRRYDAVIPDRDDRLRTRAQLFRDSELVLSWDLEGLEIRRPLVYEGVQLRGGFLNWADHHLDPEEAEAALVLRRACEISMGRQTPWDELSVAADVGDFMLGVCHTFQPGRAEVAVRMKGTSRDFTHDPDRLLAD